jgi:sigma-B regulation protein RsbU (phosphoserine phosphatase)
MALSRQKPKKQIPEVDSASLSLQEENLRLQRAVEELTILNDLAREIGASHNSEDIMQKIIRRSLRAVNAEQGVITLVSLEPNEPTKTLVRGMATSSQHQPFRLNQSLLGWMYRNQAPLLINDPRNDERFRGVKWDEAIQSLLCVPLVIKSELRGILTVYNKKGGTGFAEDDQRLLAIIAGQSAQVVENARLYEEERALLRMQEELRLAAKIQLELLPKTGPQITGYDIAGKSIPAQSVGGDYYDFISIDENRLAICLGDVSGKGLPASLLMANLQATIRGQALLSVSARDCISRSNTLLYHSTDIEKFATVFYAILDTRPQGPSGQHTLCYSNAGHNEPLLFSEDPSRSARPLKIGGTLLGIFQDFPFQEETTPLNPGDLLLVYSDGITEAMNAKDEEFGEKRLMAVVRENWGDSSSELIEKIVTAVKMHAGDTPQSDDITLVVVKRA